MPENCRKPSEDGFSGTGANTMAQRQKHNPEGIQGCATSANREFRKIPSLGFLYEVNENGTIMRNVKSKKQSKIKLDRHHSDKGYYVSFVHLGGRSAKARTKRVMIHRVVAECWLGPCPEGMQVDHIDRNPHNNDWRNLRYVTLSEQMRNRDHNRIAETGSANLERARQMRAKPVCVTKDGRPHLFTSISECARWICGQTDADFEHVRYRLRRKRKHVVGFDVSYPAKADDILNEETGHDSPKGQGTVHLNSDLTGNYTTAFNKGKQQEVEMRFKHTKLSAAFHPEIIENPGFDC